jgi:hypothetical protein
MFSVYGFSLTGHMHVLSLMILNDLQLLLCYIIINANIRNFESHMPISHNCVPV